MPHHGVLKDNTTTKLSVVFDVSAKSSKGISLNDTLHVSPNFQSDLFSILLKFRTYPVAVSADIEKMYGKIIIADDHKSIQRIVW